MTFHATEEPEYSVLFGDAPLYVRQAHMRLARATSVMQVYRRRGWNDSAARYAHQVAQDEFQAALDRWDFDEANPPLF